MWKHEILAFVILEILNFSNGILLITKFLLSHRNIHLDNIYIYIKIYISAGNHFGGTKEKELAHKAICNLYWFQCNQ